jgi:nitrogen regulatory protein P-II 1
MKEIKAYIQPFMLQKVTDTLREMRIPGMSVSELKGFGRERDPSDPQYIREDITDFMPKVKIEIVCPDEDCERIVQAILKTAHTGRRGDGKVFISPIEQAISIRTGETGDHAI